MTDENVWRLDIAKSLVDQLSVYNELSGFFVGGSVGRGIADKFSDLEVCCIWNEQLSDQRRKEIIEKLEGKRFTEFTTWKSQNAVEDNIHIQDFQVDIWHSTSEINDKVFSDVLNDFNTDLSKQNLLYTFSNCISLYDRDRFIQRWIERSQEYSNEYSKKIVLEHLRFFTNGNAAIHIKRNDLTILYGLISGLQKRMYLALLGLNKIYYPTYKRMDLVLDSLKIKPRGIIKSFQNVYKLSPHEAWNETEIMMKEVILVVESVFPEIKDLSFFAKIEDQRKVFKPKSYR